MKVIPKDSLIIRKSFKLPYSSGEIWGEELDGLNMYTDIVIDKFLSDMVTIRMPSSPGLIAIHLKSTLVNEQLADIIVTELGGVKRPLQKVVFVGLDRAAQKLVKAKLDKVGAAFTYNFINDYEKAKEWLVNR